MSWTDSPWDYGITKPEILSMSAVMRLRRLSKHITIRLVEKEDHASLRIQPKGS
jgi:hypothetical protein